MEFGLEIWQPTMTQFSEFVEIVGALSLLHLYANGFEVFTDLTHFIDRGLLFVPLAAQSGGL